MRAVPLFPELFDSGPGETQAAGDGWLQTAYRYLAKARTEAELWAHLVARGMPEGDIEKLIAHCRERGYVNDEELGRTLAERYARERHWGREKIRARLLARGLPEERVEDALTQVFTKTDEARIAAEALERKRPKDNVRALRFLGNRGFSSDAIDLLMSMKLPEPEE